MTFKSMYRDAEFKLSKCPLCGAEPKIKHIGNTHTSKRSIEIKCHNCNILLKTSALKKSMDWLEDVSVEKWNERFI